MKHIKYRNISNVQLMRMRCSKALIYKNVKYTTGRTVVGINTDIQFDRDAWMGE